MIQRNRTLWLCLVALSLVLAGCQTAAPIEAQQGAPPAANRNAAPPTGAPASAADACSLPNDSGYGLAIVSATLSSQGPTGYSVKYNQAGGMWLTDKFLLLDRERFFVKFSSDFTDVFGKLFILRLKAGTYQFKDWTAVSGLMKETPFDIHPLKFTVEAGRAVYLGGFDPSIQQGENLFHQTVYSSWILLHDHSSRDMPVFFSKCPGFDTGRVDVRIIDTSPWLPHAR